MFGVPAPSTVGIFELGDSGYSTLAKLGNDSPATLRSIRLLHSLVLLEFGKAKDIFDDTRFGDSHELDL